MRKLYLIWRIWAITRNLNKFKSTGGEVLLHMYYMELESREYPSVEIKT